MTSTASRSIVTPSGKATFERLSGVHAPGWSADERGAAGTTAAETVAVATITAATATSAYLNLTRAPRMDWSHLLASNLIKAAVRSAWGPGAFTLGLVQAVDFSEPVEHLGLDRPSLEGRVSNGNRFGRERRGLALEVSMGESPDEGRGAVHLFLRGEHRPQFFPLAGRREQDHARGLELRHQVLEPGFFHCEEAFVLGHGPFHQYLLDEPLEAVVHARQARLGGDRDDLVVERVDEQAQAP